MKPFGLMSVSALWIALMDLFWIVSLCQTSSLRFVFVAAIPLFFITFAVYDTDHAGGSRQDRLNNPERAIFAKYSIK